MRLLKLHRYGGIVDTLYAVAGEGNTWAEVVEVYAPDDLSCACGGGISPDPYDKRESCQHIAAVQAWLRDEAQEQKRRSEAWDHNPTRKQSLTEALERQQAMELGIST